MFALRRASIPLRNQSNCTIVVRACCVSKDISSGFTEKGRKIENNYSFGNHIINFCSREFAISPSSLFWTRNISSQIGTKSSDGEDELEDGFSDLELLPETSEHTKLLTKDHDDVNIEEDVSEEEAVHSELGLLDDEIESKEKINAATKSNSLSVFKLLVEMPKESVNSALDNWVKEGKPLGRDEISLAILNLRKKRFYKKALQLYEWVEANKQIEFTEKDYKSYLDLIAKIQGIPKAEKYVTNLSESFQTEPIYRTLLANCVATGNVKKSEAIFNKIRDLGSPLTAFSCNQLLLLYKRVDRKKIADVLKLMEKENVKPSLFTYKLLVDVKGRAHDISGMEDVAELMKSEGIEPDVAVKSLMAKHYIFAGLKEKAEAVLKEIEGEDINEHRVACKELLPLYAALGKADDVERIWKVCEANANLEECSACIDAWGKLGNIEKAENVFELMEKSRTRLPPRFYNCMIKVYASHKLLLKGKELAKKMAESGMRIGPLTIDALVKLHVEAGEVEKADSILRKAAQQSQIKPLYCSYIVVLDHYARRGDIHNAEKIFQITRQSGYIGRIGMYQTLLKAYQAAKAPIYGFRERLKADNLFPNKAVAAQLAAMDAFKKTEISELLD